MKNLVLPSVSFDTLRNVTRDLDHHVTDPNLKEKLMALLRAIESRRCVRITYEKETQFSIDVEPCQLIRKRLLIHTFSAVSNSAIIGV
ncbi:MAG: hypothetical protein AB9903_22230 [Vulcanimicrobiota bacterium]